MLVTNLSDIDFSVYKRFFALGCSFTNWHWPTWADLLNYDNNLEYYNYGYPAMGNTYIVSMLEQLDRHYKFCETDCVAIGWSTFGRQSLYRTQDIKTMISNVDTDYFNITTPNHWITAGDTYATLVQDTSTLNLDCDRGRLIKDLSCISLVTNKLKHSSFTAFQFYTISPERMCEFDNAITSTHKQDIFEMYKDLDNDMISKSMHDDIGIPFGENEYSYQYYSAWDDNVLTDDKHPNSLQHLQYITNAGYNFSQQTIDHANHCHEVMQKVVKMRDLLNSGEWQYSAYPTGYFPL